MTGPHERLALLGSVATDPKMLPEQLETLRLPVDLEAFETLVDARGGQIDQLLLEGRDLVERAERIVCRLYGVPDELTEEVVASAAQRALSRRPADPGVE